MFRWKIVFPDISHRFMLITDWSFCWCTIKPASGTRKVQAVLRINKIIWNYFQNQLKNPCETCLQSCWQSNVQLLTTLVSSWASSLCNKFSADVSACAQRKIGKMPNKTNKIVGVGACERKFSQWKFLWAWLLSWSDYVTQDFSLGCCGVSWSSETRKA